MLTKLVFFKINLKVEIKLPRPRYTLVTRVTNDQMSGVVLGARTSTHGFSTLA